MQSHEATLIKQKRCVKMFEVV